MTMKRFRTAALVLIGFNVAGTVLTWVAHLQKAGIVAANAIFAGTQFTGPLLLAAIGLVAFGLTFSSRRILATTGVVLLGLYGAGFAFGEVTELFQHNVGISAARWNVVLAGSVLGAVIGIATAVGAVLLLAGRRHHPIEAASSMASPTT